MKIINKTSKQIIDVPSEHALMLFTQGWEEFKEAVVEKVIKNVEIPVFQQVEEAIKNRGRPKKNHF